MNLHRSFSSMAHHSLFVSCDNSLWVWGNNEKGALGLGDKKKRRRAPRQIMLPSESAILSLACGAHHNIVLSSHNCLVWGDNSRGQLGLGDLSPRGSPHPLLFPNQADKFVRVQCGGHFSAALTNSGTIYVWGDNHYGQLGLGDKRYRSTPTVIPDLPPISDFACGANHMLLVTVTGNLLHTGQFGSAPHSRSSTIYSNEWELEDVKRVFAGGRHTLALTNADALYYWERNLGFGARDETMRCPRIMFSGGVLDVACGYAHTLILMKDGCLYYFRNNPSGSDPSQPLLLARIVSTDFVSIVAGWNSSFILTCDGELLEWVPVPDSPTFEMSKISRKMRKRRICFPKSSRKKAAFTLRKPWLAGYRFASLWGDIFFWLFLGRKDLFSPLFGLPLEILFNIIILI